MGRGEKDAGREAGEEGGRKEKETGWGEETEEGGETEQQSQVGGGEQATDESLRVETRRVDKQGRSGGQECCQRFIHKEPQRQLL